MAWCLINYKENFCLFFRTHLPPTRICDFSDQAAQYHILGLWVRASSLILHFAHYGEIIIYLFTQIGLFKDEIFSRNPDNTESNNRRPPEHRSPYEPHLGARGNVVGWGTMLQAGRSRVRFPMRSGFFNWRNPSGRTMALGSTQPLTEMNTRNLSRCKGRPARKADNLTAICEPIV
jgi:hypothetical protein